jgi:hypothetical protein
MKSAMWDDDMTDFCLSCVTETSRMRSSCILRISTKSALKQFKQRLSMVPEFSWYPYFLALILMEMRLENLPAKTRMARDTLWDLEKTTGTFKTHYKNKPRPIQEKWNAPGFDDAPAKLTSLACDCVYNESACRSRKTLVMWLGSQHNLYLHKGVMDKRDITSRTFDQKRHFLEMSATESENRMQYFGKRAEIQLQMVCIPKAITAVPKLLLHTKISTHSRAV